MLCKIRGHSYINEAVAYARSAFLSETRSAPGVNIQMPPPFAAHLKGLRIYLTSIRLKKRNDGYLLCEIRSHFRSNEAAACAVLVLFSRTHRAAIVNG